MGVNADLVAIFHGTQMDFDRIYIMGFANNTHDDLYNGNIYICRVIMGHINNLDYNQSLDLIIHWGPDITIQVIVITWDNYWGTNMC
jgi:hypothetical protein